MSTHKKEIIWLLYLIAGVILLFFIAPLLTGNNVPLCLFKLITHYPCPGCGITRGSVAFWNFDFKLAYYYNLLAIPLNIFLIVSIFWLTYDILAKKHSFFKVLNYKYPWYVYVIIVLIVIFNWIRNIQHGI